MTLLLLLPIGNASGSSPDLEGAAENGRYQDYPGNFLRIPLDVASGIFTDTLSLKRNAVLTWAGIAAAFALDDDVREFWRSDIKSSRTDDASSVLYDSGTSEFAVMAIGTGLGVSYLMGNEDLNYTFALVAQGVILSQAVTELTKRGSGRERPRDSPDDSQAWKTDGMAFFSGHASGAWAAASVLSHRYPDNRLVAAASYTWATAVSLSRINDDGHWSSDVLVGSIAGYLIGRSTVALSAGSNSRNQLQAAPLISPDAVGIAFSRRF
ncbi:MAG: phosphatase PAP2 family protein [Aquisalimonadaceae bacterium]